MKKIIKFKCRKNQGLVKPICEEKENVVKIKCTDKEIDGVNCRVWSAFQNDVSGEKSLENLMLNRLESDESESVNEEQELQTLKM